MTSYTDSELEVLNLTPGVNARVFGAPGSGKTTLLIELLKKQFDSADILKSEVLVLTGSRVAAKKLSERVEERLQGIYLPEMVRSAESFAFAILNAKQANLGERSIKLLTGAAEDLLIRSVVDQNLEFFAELSNLPKEALISVDFRNEIRDLRALAIDYELGFADLEKIDIPSEFAELKNIWSAALQILAVIELEKNSRYPDEFSSAELNSRAITAIAEEQPDLPLNLPRLVLIDDAQELTPGAENLIRALRERGSTIWAFGDPDVATRSFQVANRGILATALQGSETKDIALNVVYRHGKQIRDLVTRVTSRIGAAGAGRQRAARVKNDLTDEQGVQFTTAKNIYEQAGIIAHRIKEKRSPSKKVVVICRSQDEVAALRNLLDDHELQTRSTSGGLVLKNFRIARDLLFILRRVVEGGILAGEEILDLMNGPLLDFDVISTRRLSRQLVRAETERAEELDSQAKQLPRLLEQFVLGQVKFNLTPELKKLLTLQEMYLQAVKAKSLGLSLREILWSIWQNSKKSQVLQDTVLNSNDQLSRVADRELDAVMTLFYALQRHEEQMSKVSDADLLIELQESDVAQDSLAKTADSLGVLVTTPQGVPGQEFETVIILGPQDGVWPNLKPRGSILGIGVLQTLLQSGIFEHSSRTTLLHDELRLFAAAISKAKSEVLVVALHSEDENPSVFFDFGKEQMVQDLPHKRYSLRSYIAERRGELEARVNNDRNAAILATLALQGKAGAHPDDWYGAKPYSSPNNLLFQQIEGEEKVRVSPSEVQSIEECPLNWLLRHLGSETHDIVSNLGTLIHQAFEKYPDGDFKKMKKQLEKDFEQLDFHSSWQREIEYQKALQMLAAISDYTRDTLTTRELLALEKVFEFEISDTLIRGKADRIELATSDDGKKYPVVVDLKTGAAKPNSADVQNHAQMQAYQAALKLDKNLKDTLGLEADGLATKTEAVLLYVNPAVATTKATYRTFEQAHLDEEAMQNFSVRIASIRELISSAEFLANVKEHCLNTSLNFQKNCSLHHTKAVSFK